MFEVVRYTQAYADEWNHFVDQSKNGTFLFDRRYMDYHSDRFTDCSLMVRRDGRLYALLPASVKDGVLTSHAGLTYGGLVMSRRCTAMGVCASFQAVNAFLRSMGVSKVVYKAVPWIYHQIPAEEDLFALTDVCKARLVIRDISSAITADSGMKFAESRRSGLRKARGLDVYEATLDDVPVFWHILDDNLQLCHGVSPVHTAAELQLLMGRFPASIKLFLVRRGEVVLGGTLLYVTAQVVHTQYISATPEGKRCGALDLLFDRLIHTDYAAVRYFDFGKSTSTTSARLNERLIFQKEGFGARAVCYDTYEWEL